MRNTELRGNRRIGNPRRVGGTHAAGNPAGLFRVLGGNPRELPRLSSERDPLLEMQQMFVRSLDQEMEVLLAGLSRVGTCQTQATPEITLPVGIEGCDE